jgi:hypothetical protein
MRHSFWILAVLAHSHEIVSDPLPRHARVFFDLLVEQAKRFRPLHGCHGILPDDHLGMKDEPGCLVRADDVSAKVSQSNVPIALLRRGHQHAVD